MATPAVVGPAIWCRIITTAALALGVTLAYSQGDKPNSQQGKPNRIERTAKKVAEGTERTAKRAGKFVEKTATRAGKFVERTAEKTGNAVKRALE